MSIQEVSSRWALVGGGRWARVLAERLCEVLPTSLGLDIVTNHNRNVIAAWIPRHARRPIRILTNIEDVLSDPRTQAVLIANRSELHAGTAQRMLGAGKHVFVEKPFAMNVADAESLVQIADQRGLTLAVGLEYLFASYLHHFRAALGTARITSLDLEWFDPLEEFRYGEIKRSDQNTPLLHDILPHVWSILQILLPSGRAEICEAAVHGSRAEVKLSCDHAVVKVHIRRDAERRARHIRLTLGDGRTAELDFSSEPGYPFLDGRELAPCPEWGRAPGPVARELMAFRSAIATAERPPHDATVCLGSVYLAAEAERVATEGGTGRSATRPAT